VRLLLAFCLILFCQTSGFAANNSEAFVEGCNDMSVEALLKKHGFAQCTAVIGTLLVLGPYLREDMKFCPPDTRPLFAKSAMNKYVKAHPYVLDPDAPNMDRLIMLILAFREEWPCK
jgi:hypothetical protein